MQRMLILCQRMDRSTHLKMREERPNTARIRMHERHQCLSNLEKRAQVLARAQMSKSMTKKIARQMVGKIKTLS